MDIIKQRSDNLTEGDVEHIFRFSQNPTEYLEQEKNTRPEFITVIDKIISHLESRCYHEMTDACFEYLEQNQQSIDENKMLNSEKLLFLHIVISPTKTKLDVLRFGQLIRNVCQNMQGNVAIKVIEAYEADLAKNADADLIGKAVKSYHLTLIEEYGRSGDVLAQIESKLETQLGFDLSVFSQFYRASSALYKAQDDSGKFYKHASLFLAYTSMNSLSEEERLQWSYDLGIAALAAESEYNFGELLQLPVTNCLKGTDREWLYDLLHSFNEGSWSLFMNTMNKYQRQIQASPLAPKLDVAKAKIPILALMDLSFRKPKANRQLSFQEIADHCQIKLDEVEVCLIRAMSKSLIRGKIDQLKQTVALSWVCPRILDSARLEIMGKRFMDWHTSTDELVAHLQSQTAELLVA